MKITLTSIKTTIRAVVRSLDNLLCACNKKPCEGVCREKHLKTGQNTRKGMEGLCTAAYRKERK